MAINVVAGPAIQRLDSLSNGIDIAAGALISITSPAAWSPANVSFQISYDGVTYYDLWRGGKEVLVACGPSRSILVEPDFRLRGVYVKFRSGSSAAPVPQQQLRTFAIAIETP